MALQARLVQKMSQQLLMTPQLQQAIKLLQMGRIDYLEAIEHELLENPLLEEVKEYKLEPDGTPQDAEAQIASFDSGENDSDSDRVNPENISLSNNSENVEKKSSDADFDAYLDYLSDWRGAATPKGLIDHEDRPEPDALHTKSESLSEHLLFQLRFSDFSEQELAIALHIIGNLDNHGYLTLEAQEIATAADCSVEFVEKVIARFRDFDPPGVASKNLQECLFVQLENMGLENALPAKIVQNHLEKLEKKRLDLIAKEEQVPLEAVQSALKVIRTLEPQPARNFSSESARAATPDVYIRKQGDNYIVSLNEDGLPKLRLSNYYIDLLKNRDAVSEEQKTYLNDRLKAATWLLKSDFQRRQTILKVAESIVKFQRGFLDHGISRLKPLVLKDVADDISMHESTVSRVTSNKFVHTHHGVFELKFFFTTGIKGALGEVSSSSVKERIKNLISSEDLKSPMSDQDIVALLLKENIDIARRTVAKYREALGIDSSSVRRKGF